MSEIEKLEERIEKLEEMYHSQNEHIIKNKYELKELISNAVSEGNKKVLDKLEEHDKRIIELENKEAKIARAAISKASAPRKTFLFE